MWLTAHKQTAGINPLNTNTSVAMQWFLTKQWGGRSETKPLLEFPANSLLFIHNLLNAVLKAIKNLGPTILIKLSGFVYDADDIKTSPPTVEGERTWYFLTGCHWFGCLSSMAQTSSAEVLILGYNEKRVTDLDRLPDNHCFTKNMYKQHVKLHKQNGAENAMKLTVQS